MSLTTAPAEDATRKKKSTFHLSAINSLGLEAQRVRSAMLGLSLSAPARYFSLRALVIQHLVETSVTTMYENYWDILSDGIVRDKDGARQQISYTDESNKVIAFLPRLPEQQINAFALRIAEAVRQIAEECVETILPLKYQDLAVSTSKGILRSKGIDM